jgi:hypothetical protein
MFPVGSDQDHAAENIIRAVVGYLGTFAVPEGSFTKNYIKPGVRVCFYAKRSGVVADATVASQPELAPDKRIPNSSRCPWTFRLEDVHLYVDSPIPLD